MKQIFCTVTGRPIKEFGCISMDCSTAPKNSIFCKKSEMVSWKKECNYHNWCKWQVNKNECLCLEKCRWKTIVKPVWQCKCGKIKNYKFRCQRCKTTAKINDVIINRKSSPVSTKLAEHGESK